MHSSSTVYRVLASHRFTHLSGCTSGRDPCPPPQGKQAGGTVPPPLVPQEGRWLSRVLPSHLQAG